MPAVPNLPGVPPLSSYLLGALPGLLLTDLVFALIGETAAPWGIYLGGVPVVDADSVVTFDFRQEYTVSDYPLEQGAFESYDKVQVPFDVRVRYAAGGSEFNRQLLLTSIDDIVGDLNLYDVVTPEIVYPSCNVVHQDYRRTNVNGVGLLQIDVWLVQVRVTAQAAFQNVQNPQSASAKSLGIVQPSEVTPAMRAILGPVT